MPTKKNSVPRGTDNPIDYLLGRGETLATLSVAWGLNSTDNIRRLRVFRHVPRYNTAALMAETFGWSSAGEVMDFWSARVAAAKEIA